VAKLADSQSLGKVSQLSLSLAFAHKISWLNHKRCYNFSGVLRAKPGQLPGVAGLNLRPLTSLVLCWLRNGRNRVDMLLSYKEWLWPSEFQWGSDPKNSTWLEKIKELHCCIECTLIKHCLLGQFCSPKALYQSKLANGNICVHLLCWNHDLQMADIAHDHVPLLRTNLEIIFLPYQFWAKNHETWNSYLGNNKSCEEQMKEEW
jgi:hypothetical protein